MIKEVIHDLIFLAGKWVPITKKEIEILYEPLFI